MQGFLAGMTDYSEQTMKNIREDICGWIEYTQRTKDNFENRQKQIDKSYWDNTVPFDFKVFCISFPAICDTLLSDFNIVLKESSDNSCSPKSVKIMKNISKVVRENMSHNKSTFKNREDGNWKSYNDENYRLTESLYCMAGDFLATLLDVSNAVCRMEDYMEEDSKSIISQTNNNFQTNIDSSIHIGDGNTIKNSTIGGKAEEKPSKAKKTISQIIWQIVVPICVGVAVVAICLWLGITKGA